MRWLICCLAIVWGQVTLAQDVALSPEDMRQLAAQSLETGRVDQAEQLAQALLQRDPTDHLALLVLSHVARLKDDPTAAVKAAREAWRTSKTDEARYAAAVTAAQVLSSAGQRGLAQIWLRRAVQVSPSDAHKDRAARDYQYVRSKNPWQVNLAFSIAPNSNINNGGDDSVQQFQLGFLIIEDSLSPEEQALSGIEIRSGGSLRYRLKDRGQNGATDLIFAVSRTDYRLSDDAKNQAPQAQNSDYAQAKARLMLLHTTRLSDRLSFGLSASVDQSWTGGEQSFRDYTLGLRGVYTLPGSAAIVTNLTLFDKFDEGSDRDYAANGWDMRLGWVQQLGANRLRLDANVRRSFSELTGALDYQSNILSVGFDLGKPMLGAYWSFDAYAGQRHYEYYPIFGVTRQPDKISGATVTIKPQGLDLYGFAPVVSVSASRLDSNIARFDRETLGLSLGFKSAF